MSGSPWDQAGTVEGFVRSSPNGTLLHVAARERRAAARLLDIGCGAGRNAVPLATSGWEVVGTDTSQPMLTAAAARVADAELQGRLRLVRTPMHQLPFVSDSFDFIVTHGIWNLARSGWEFRTAAQEPLPDESFVFTEFSGEPQCLLTEEQIVSELAAYGFEGDPSLPLRELNQPPKGTLHTTSGPVIFEGLFRRIR